MLMYRFFGVWMTIQGRFFSEETVELNFELKFQRLNVNQPNPGKGYEGNIGQRQTHRGRQGMAHVGNCKAFSMVGIRGSPGKKKGGWRSQIMKGLVSCQRVSFSGLPCKYSLCSHRQEFFESSLTLKSSSLPLNFLIIKHQILSILGTWIETE